MGHTLTLEQARALPPGQLRDFAYNCLDVTGTREIADTLLPRLGPNQRRAYAFERSLQAPAMSMMMRGVNVDLPKRRDMVQALERELKKDLKAVAADQLVQKVWDGTRLETGWCSAALGKHHKWPKGVPDAERRCERCGTPRVAPDPFNPNSSAQVMHLFYDLFGLEPLRNKHGEVSADEDVLERIGWKYKEYTALTGKILLVRDKKKQLGSLNARLSPDGRYPSSFNVGAAWTGRFSSSKNPYQEGGNLQNVAPRHRAVFLADPGMDLGYADLMQGESNAVAHLSGDERYIEAHRVGDVHTYATRLVWPDMPWTGDLSEDKKIAKQLPPWDNVEGHDYRFQSKRIQHGGNYGLTPFGIAMIAHIPLAEAKRAYYNYMGEFDGIPAWHKWVNKEIVEHRPLINPFGREITLFGRPWDTHTLRQGLAFLPQSMIADIISVAMFWIWRDLEPLGVQLLAQVHDAFLFQYPRGRMDLVREVLVRMQIPVPVRDIHGKTRVMQIGVEAAVGRNWGHKSADNPLGIDEKPISDYLKENPL